jgi:hypothetical protein
MNEITQADFGLLRRQVRDVAAVVGNIDHRFRKQDLVSIHRPAGLSSRFAACALIARAEKRNAEDVARQHFSADRELAQLIEIRTAVAPAQSTVATWAAELAAVVTQDVAENLLPATVLAQLRQLSGQPYAFVEGATVRIPVHSPTPSGGFVLEGNSIPVAALIIAAINLKPKKAAAIVAITREIANGAPGNVETSLHTLLAQDLGLAIDSVLLSNAAITAAAPAGLLNGVSPITAATGGGANAMMADIRSLVSAISPCVRPCLIMGTTQFSSTAILSPPVPFPVLAAPTMPANQVIAVDAFAFASALGAPDFSTDENPAIHMESTAPLPIIGGTATPPVIGSVAAPVTSLWQTACIGLRTIVEADWVMRRANAVSYLTGCTW